MAHTKNTDLRDNLFEAMERLFDAEDKFNSTDAIAIATLAKVIIESAKTELIAAKMLGAKSLPTNFIEIVPYDASMRQLSVKEFDKLTG